MVGYMMIPMGLTFEQQHIYILLYSKCDFNTMTVKYTVDQLITDSHKGFELTPMKVRNIIKFLTDNSYIEYTVSLNQFFKYTSVDVKPDTPEKYKSLTEAISNGKRDINIYVAAFYSDSVAIGG